MGDRKHTDAVSEVMWTSEKSSGKTGAEVAGENLMSVAADGKIIQWNMKKGLEQKILMNLKRIYNPNLGSNAFANATGGSAGSEASLSTNTCTFRQSVGLSVDSTTVGTDNTYIVSTDDGLIHKCSTSYNEQYLETYYGH